MSCSLFSKYVCPLPSSVYISWRFCPWDVDLQSAPFSPPPPELARDGTDSELPAELAASLAARAGLDSGTSTSERGDSATPSIDFDTDEEEEDDEEEDIYPDDQ